MKPLGSNRHRNGNGQPTLADLILTVSEITRNDELTAHVIADLINSQRVRVGGSYRDCRVVVR